MRANHPLETLHTTLTITRDADEKWHLEPNPLGWGDSFAPSSPEQARRIYVASFGRWSGEYVCARGQDGDEAWELASSLANGSYQRDLVDGLEAVSGSTLRGNAKKYASRYRASREALFARFDAAGLPYSIETFGLGRRKVLVYGTPLEGQQ
jgi:hypothetical protein